MRSSHLTAPLIGSCLGTALRQRAQRRFDQRYRLVGALRKKRFPPVALVTDRSILDQYISEAPSAQNALDIFAGEWSSKFPEHLNLKTFRGLPRCSRIFG